jgi:hypothetical protein
MNTFKNLLPVLAAIISAIALLLGYAYQKRLERDAEIRKTRQEIYSRLISNITERNTILGRLLEQSPEYAKARPEERPQVERELWATGRLTDAKLSKNEGDRTEVIASLCLYGTDEAIDAYAKYAKANVEGKGGDLGGLIVDLRQSIYKETHIAADEANLTIWNDPKYLKKSSAAK